MAPENIFDNNSYEYDQWFTVNKDIFTAELNLIKSLIPNIGKGIEIGVGTGRFASELKIPFGIEPSIKMAEIAKSRNIELIQANAENLPIKDKSFDFVLMITTICFVNDVNESLFEINRILRGNGFFILAFIDKESELGKIYQIKKSDNKFYRDANFYSTNDIIDHLSFADFELVETRQCLFIEDGKINTSKIEDYYGTGGFVAIKSIKSKQGVST